MVPESIELMAHFFQVLPILSLAALTLVTLQVYAHTSIEAYFWVYRLELYVGAGLIGLVILVLAGVACWQWVSEQIEKLRQRRRQIA